MNFLTKKPKFFWLSMCSCLASLVLGIPGILFLNISYSPRLNVILFWTVVGLWLIAAFSMAAYYFRQACGVYKSIDRIPLKEQIW